MGVLKFFLAGMGAMPAALARVFEFKAQGVL
jgi:hypothetical protein